MLSISTTPLKKTALTPPKSSLAAVPLLDVQRENAPLFAEIMEAIRRVCQSGCFVLGPECQKLESALADYCQVQHAVGCASGSDALLLALMACGVGVGDEVIVPSYTFFATASAVWRLGARPVFVDIEPESYNIDPDLIEKNITAATRAIIPVHLFGQCAEMDSIGRIAEEHNLAIIEDAAQAIGAQYKGRPAGSMGHVGCFSFYPTKNLGGFGDGGMLVTDDAEMAQKLRLLRGHGMHPRYYHQTVGINSRLDAIQAAVLGVKLPHLERQCAKRQANARRYTQMFCDFGLDRVLGLPRVQPERRHVWNQYVIRIPDGRRDALRQHLTQLNIGTEIYYPVPLHEQECFSTLNPGPGILSETERAARETIALPIFPEIACIEQEAVVEQIAVFLGARVICSTPASLNTSPCNRAA